MKKAVLLLGHGSTEAEANNDMYQIIELLRQRTDYIVEAGFLELNPPDIQTGIDHCVEHGATEILMIPYFLHLGAHVRHDLPNEMAEGRRRYPEVEFKMGGHLGFHRLLAEIVLDRVRESGWDDGEPPAE